MATFELNVKINGIEQSVSTIGGLEQALAATNAQLSQVEANSKEFSFLTNQAGNLEKILVAVSGDAQTLSTNLNSVNTAATQLNTTITETATAASELGNNAATQKLNENIGKTTQRATSLRTELRKITMELQNLEPGSQRFQELSVRAGELRDQIGDTQAVVSALAGSVGERLGRALSSTIQIGVAGFQAVTAATSLFGVEADALEPTLVRLTALLNLSQALETFGGLPDKINEITAGFSSLSQSAEGASAATNAAAAATTSETVAAEGATIANSANAIANQADAAASLEDAAAKTAEAVATNGATVATTALGLAMKALPIIAIAAAIGTLVYGIYEYVTASGDASKGDEERKKAMEEANKAQQEYTAAIAKESVELTTLLIALGQTNPLSKERNKLIKDINKEYGTTIKNLKDEVLFQDQINTTVKDYIALQTVRARIAASVKAEERLVQDVIDAENYLNSIIATEKQLKKELPTRKLANFMLKEANDALEKQVRHRTALAQKEKDYIEKIFPNIENAGKETKKQTAAVQGLTAAEEFLLEIQKQRSKAEVEALINAAKKTRTQLDDIEVEKKIAMDALDERLKSALEADAKEVKSGEKKTSEKQKIEDEYAKYKTEIEKSFTDQSEKQAGEEKKIRENLNAELIKQSEILQTEIVFGNESTVDTLDGLAQQEAENRIAAYQRVLDSGKLTQAEYIEVLRLSNDTQNQLLREQEATQIEIARRNAVKQLTDYRLLLESQLGVKLDYEDKKQTVDEAIAELQAKKDSATTEAEKKDIDNQILAYQNLKKTQENLEKQFGAAKEKINSETNSAIEQNDVETTRKTFEMRYKILQDYFAIANQALQQFTEQSLGGWNMALTTSLSLIDEVFRIANTKFETTTEKITAIAQVVASTLNAVFQGFIDQNDAALSRDLDNFRINADERKRIYTEQLNNNLITREAYDKNIEAIDKELYDKEQTAKKDAFEQDKKLRIAQATIAGLQGAVAAFAGAMQLGPIAGPIVGAILAASVAALTAAQISQIQKQKFDGGPGRIDAGAGATPTAASQITQSSSGGFTTFNENVSGGQTGGQTTTATGTSRMQKVYVLESDISSAQDRVRVLENNSTFG